jgi:hypothetical protein
MTMRHEGIMDLTAHRALVDRLDAHPKRRGPVKREPALLTDIAYCARCRGIMHARRTVQHRRDHDYVYESYRCDGTAREPSTCKNLVRRDVLDDWVTRWFTEGPIAGQERVETHTIPGNGLQDALDHNRRDIAELDPDEPGYADRLAELLAERTRLQSLPSEPDREESVFTGETVGEHWSRLDPVGRRAWMLEAGVRVYATRDGAWVEADDARLWWPEQD